MTQKISRGRYGERIEVKTNDEIEELATATNKMARTLEQNITDLKELDKLKGEFMDIAAHNLKVPLTHLKANTSYLLQNISDKIDKKSIEVLKDIEINSNKLQLLSEDLINVTAIQQETLQSDVFMPTDLVSMMNQVINENMSIIDSKEIALHKSFPDKAEILADVPKLKQVFSNLIDNAIKFSYKNSDINVSISPKDSAFLVTVQDHGVGIREEELSKIFQKFYRAPSSAVYNKEGTGLGLYLSKMIVDVHHGKIWLESESGKGTKFMVLLPKKEVFKNRYFLHSRNKAVKL
jgi:signal transduction histidine kinase